MVKKIVLAKPIVQHPVKKQGFGGDVGIPLGLLYLASYVRQENDAEVSFVDYRLEQALGKESDVEGDFSDADIVGVGACTSEMPEALKLMSKAKEMGKITVMGGIFPSVRAEEVLRSGVVDFVVRGEGEKTLSNLVNALNGKGSLADVKGLSFARDGSVINNKGRNVMPVDGLPLPAYDLAPMKDYAKLTEASIYAARGCPMGCGFCTLNKHWKFKYRARSIDGILEEISELKELGFERVHFKDEMLTLNRKWATKLFKALESADFGLKYKGKSRVDQIDSEMVELMVRAGFDMVHFGVESASQKSLDSMGKGTTKEDIRNAYHVLLEHGCRANPVYMFSWTGETRDDLLENARFIEEMGSNDKVRTYVSFITPHPEGDSDRRKGLHVVGSSYQDGLHILTTDYGMYTHKIPVAVPISLGEGGLDFMVDTYNRIAESTSAREWNPKIDDNVMANLREAEAQKWK